MRSFLAVLVVLPLLLPAAGAALPTEEGDPVLYHSITSPDGSECASNVYVPVVYAMVSTDISSTLAHTTDANGITTVTLHLEATPAAEAAGLVACPALDVTLSAAFSWPAPDASHGEGGSFSLACGATGHFSAWRNYGGTAFALGFSSVPASCDLPVVERATIRGFVQPVHPSTGLLCVSTAYCSGVYSGPVREGPNCGAGDIVFVMAKGIQIASAGHSCTRGYDDSSGYVSVFYLVFIEGTERSCSVSADGVFTRVTQPCPNELGALIDGVSWGSLVP